MGDKPVTKGRRLLRLAGMTAQVAGGYAKSRLKAVFQSSDAAQAEFARTHQRSGEIIARTLGELKGAVMKVGQMASIAKDVLPPQLAEALGQLQRQAPPMDFEVIAGQIESEFSAAPETLFRQFDIEPFASASIGQVHRAITDDGREVVVKVQYPGVDDAVDSDLGHLKFALRASGLVTVSREILDAVFAEIRARLLEELDYCNEADNVRLFGEMYRDDPRVVVPTVVGERSSQRVLTLTYEPGDHLAELDGYDQPTRDGIGQTLVSIVAEQLFQHHVVHADPNPANFAFRPDGTVVLYDFGCVKRLDVDVMRSYAATLRAGLTEDYDGLERGLLELGARNPKGAPVDAEFYKPWRDLLAQPLVGQTPYDYGTSNIHRQMMALVPKFVMKHLTSFQPPAELVFVDRVVVGHYGNLVTIGARGQYRPIIDGHLDDMLKTEPARP